MTSLDKFELSKISCCHSADLLLLVPLYILGLSLSTICALKTRVSWFAIEISETNQQPLMVQPIAVAISFLVCSFEIIVPSANLYLAYIG